MKDAPKGKPKITVPKTCKVKKGLRFIDDQTVSERVGGITTEFIKGFELLEKYDLAATFFWFSTISS